MRFRVTEFRPGLFHVIDGDVPVHDKSRNGDDKPLVFRDRDIASECAKGMNLDEEIAEGLESNEEILKRLEDKYQ